MVVCSAPATSWSGFLAGQQLRMVSATALSQPRFCASKREMAHLLSQRHEFADASSPHAGAQLPSNKPVDQLFHSAKAAGPYAPVLARYGRKARRIARCRSWSQETLAEDGRNDALAREFLRTIRKLGVIDTTAAQVTTTDQRRPARLRRRPPST